MNGKEGSGMIPSESLVGTLTRRTHTERETEFRDEESSKVVSFVYSSVLVHWEDK